MPKNTNYSPTFPMFPGAASTVTPSDTVNLPYPAVIYVGTAGNVQVSTPEGDTVVFTNVASGAVIPVQVSRVWATSTTASGLIAIY